MQDKAFSVDLVGDFALFKKNDTNDTVHISYNFIHKPAVLGIFGAILGLGGYSQSGTGSHPEYYRELNQLKIAIRPHYHEPLKKVITGFNNASGMGSDDGTWQVREQVLVGNPQIVYTIYVIEDENSKRLKKKTSKYELEYPLYFGKNEFFAHYEKYTEYEVGDISEDIVNIHSLIKKQQNGESFSIRKFTFNDFDPLALNESSGYMVFEQLPYDFDEHGFYMKDLFVWTQNKVEVNTSSGFKKLIPQKGEPVNVQFI
ncbi:CRISPR-associated protein Cas5 [bacterium]|nr:CRISPR-associated protein Cas5 [bacterium]